MVDRQPIDELVEQVRSMNEKLDKMIGRTDGLLLPGEIRYRLRRVLNQPKEEW